ncbi:MAG: BlaI/MecI/CopY family transcriptional regulator, partial [Bacteroidota bacterium]
TTNVVYCNGATAVVVARLIRQIMAKTKPSEAELEILQILWAQQPCSVKYVHEQISKQRKVGYTTTLKQMQRMLEKGLVMRSEGQGKSHVYQATTSAESIRGTLFDGLLSRVFGDSVSDLVLHALGNEKTSDEELEKIRDFLGELEKQSTKKK